MVEYNEYMEIEQKRKMLEILSKTGLSENESKVFLVLLELGRGTVTQITRKAGLNRTTGYDILDGLTARGLASVSGREPKQEYLAESPDRLVEMLKNSIVEKQAELENISALLPELRSLHNVAGRPKVRFYEGTKGLEDVYEDTLTSKEEIRAYVNVGEMHEGLRGYFPKYYERRTEKNIFIRAIIPDTVVGKMRASKDSQEKRVSALVPAEKYNFSPEINIYDDKIMIASWREKLGIIIESAEIADAMKKIYELAWIGAREENRRQI